MKRRSETGDRVSSLAGKWARITAEQIRAMDEAKLEAFASDMRSAMASLLRQDEVKGLRGKKTRKVVC